MAKKKPEYKVVLAEIEIFKQLKNHYLGRTRTNKSPDHQYDAKLWIWENEKRCKLMVSRRYRDGSIAEVSVSFTSDLQYCCRVLLNNFRYRVLNLIRWEQMKLNGLSHSLIDLIDEAFRSHEIKREQVENELRVRASEIEALRKNLGITFHCNPKSIHELVAKIGAVKIEFNVFDRLTKFSINKIDIPNSLSVNQFQDLIQNLSFMFGGFERQSTKIKRKITIDPSHIVKRIAKHDGMIWEKEWERERK